MIKLHWDYEKGEGCVELSKSFVDADKVIKLDALVDWIEILKETYKGLVEKNEQRQFAKTFQSK